MELFFVVLPVWAFLGFIGVLIAQSKGNSSTDGCLWGVLLGPIGWLIVALKRSTNSTPQPTANATHGPAARPTRKCPFCAEMILGEAIVCKHCGRDVEPLAQADPVELNYSTNAESWEKYKCPKCSERIPRDAPICEHCGRQILPLTDSPDQLTAWKICATCGKILSWDDPVRRSNGIRYHVGCLPRAADVDGGAGWIGWTG